MKRKILAAGAIVLAIGMASPLDCVVQASKEPQATAESKMNNCEKNSKGKEDGRKKMEAAAKKWDSLSKEQKQEVYKILEERQCMDEKLLDKLASLGVMEASDTGWMKEERKQMLSRLKESGKFPLGFRKHFKDGSKEPAEQK